MLRRWSLLLLGSLLWPGWGTAATYYLNPATGNNSANGSVATPWKDLTRVMNPAASPTVGPGDIINIVPGSYTKSQYQSGVNNYPRWTQAHVAGTANNPIIIQSDPSGTAIFDGERDGAWLHFNPTAARDYYVVINGIEFTHYTGGVINIGNGAVTAGTTVLARRIAVTNCSFHDIYWSGAAVTGTYAAEYVIFKGNRMLRNADPTFGVPGGADHVYYIAEGSQHVVIDGNYSETVGGMAVHIYGHFDNTWFIHNVIARRNTSVNTNHSGFIVAGSNHANTYLYNNTFYNEAATYPAIAGTTGITSTQAAISFHGGQWSLTNTHVKNNLSYGFNDGGGAGQLWSDAGLNPAGAFELDYNWWTVLGGGGPMYRWLGTSYTTVPAFQAATVYGDHDLSGNPLFTNPASGVRNFTLQAASPAINAGTFLTTAVGGGSSSTSLVVADAGYFSDGYGLIPGDLIQVTGATPATPVSVTAVNYATNTLTLASPRTWTTGASLALAWQGAAPDMGAWESAGAAPLPAPTNVRLTVVP